MSLKHYDLVWIRWIDAEHEGAWSSPDDEEVHEIAPCESVGWVIHENKVRIILAASTAIKHDGTIDEVGNKQIIPRGMIKTMRVLRKKKVSSDKTKTPTKAKSKPEEPSGEKPDKAGTPTTSG